MDYCKKYKMGGNGMNKRTIAFFLVCIMLLTLGLAGCGKDKSTSGDNTTSTGSSDPAKDNAKTDAGSSGEPVKPRGDVKIWTGTWNETLLPELLVNFYEQYPDVKVSAEYYPWDGMEDKYMVALQANNGPDVIDIAVAWTIPYAKMGKLQKLNDYFEKYNIDVSDFYDGPMQTLTVDGEYYAIPYRTEALTLIYNKRLFREAGLDPETPPTTWPELVEMAKKLTKDGVYGFGLCGKEPGNVTAQIYSMMFSNGVELFNEDMTKVAFNTPEALEAFTTWANMYLVDKCVPSSVLENDNTTNRNLFAEEKLAMYISGSYDLNPILEANPNIEMGFGLVPKFKEHKVQAGGWNIAMTNTCKNTEAAFALMNYLTSTEVGPLYSSTLSSRKSAANNPKYSDPKLKVFIEALSTGKALPGSAYMTAITNIIYNEAQAVLSGVKDPATALADAEKKANELLAQ